MAFEFFRYFLVLLVPGMIGALAYGLSSRLKTEIDLKVSIILNLLTFTTMIIGLYYLKDVYTVESLEHEFTCLHFTTLYVLLSTGINIFYGVVLGGIRRLFRCIIR